MLDPLYAIVDVPLCRERQLEPLAILDAFLAGGARLIQLRDKSPSSRDRLALADAAVARARAAGARLIVNDRADVARLSGADGVHVGQDDLGVEEVRAILGPDAIVGVSTHDEPQIEQAWRTTATYLAVGPIYSTTTKDTGYTARGLALVRRAAGGGKPVVAIGGMTIERAREAIEAGAASVAVISDLLRGDPADAVRAFRRRLGAAGSGR
ncbi:MAG TPA: thiamine phosphate synthase [Vicinamibacterales bacterium]|nr:thiamine phosphate synthase [Vicinamibacterales bacterium]